MAELSIMILCGRSPRHLYVANRQSGDVAVVDVDLTQAVREKYGDGCPGCGAGVWR